MVSVFTPFTAVLLALLVAGVTGGLAALSDAVLVVVVVVVVGGGRGAVGGFTYVESVDSASARRARSSASL